MALMASNSYVWKRDFKEGRYMSEKIKILAINTSPRDGRNTYHLLNAVIKGCQSLEDVEVETEMISVADAPEGQFNFCRGCWACTKTGKCVIEDDYVTHIYRKIAKADGVIFGTAVFFQDVTAQCKVIMDRTLGMIPMGAGKVCATAITAGSVGVSSALHTIQGFCNIHGFMDAGWVATYGKTRDKTVGKEVAYKLGIKMVRMVQMSKKIFDEDGENNDVKDALSYTNHFAYGTHTF